MMSAWKYTLPCHCTVHVHSDAGGIALLGQGPIVDIIWVTITALVGLSALVAGLGDG